MSLIQMKISVVLLYLLGLAYGTYASTLTNPLLDLASSRQLRAAIPRSSLLRRHVSFSPVFSTQLAYADGKLSSKSCHAKV